MGKGERRDREQEDGGCRLEGGEEKGQVGKGERRDREQEDGGCRLEGREEKEQVKKEGGRELRGQGEDEGEKGRRRRSGGGRDWRRKETGGTVPERRERGRVTDESSQKKNNRLKGELGIEGDQRRSRIDFHQFLHRRK